MTIVDRAIWVIERNSAEALTLTGLAEACGVSRSHLAHAFGMATGVPVMTYLRGRRLTEAARTLAAGAPDILTVALGAGYGSHEAFTRAFRDLFARTPEDVRDGGSLDGLRLIDPLELRSRPEPDLGAPELVESGPLRAVGLQEHRRFDDAIRIPAQWQRFMAEYYDAIDARCDGMPIGISQPADDDGEFHYLCAAEVDRFGDSPPELVRLEMPRRRYAVFAHAGHVSTVYDTYRAIWNQALPALGLAAADAPAIERHNDAFDPGTGDGGLTLWIPLDR